MACACLAARRALAYGIIVEMLNNAFTIVASSLSELRASLLLAPAWRQLLSQPEPWHSSARALLGKRPHSSYGWALAQQRGAAGPAAFQHKKSTQARGTNHVKSYKVTNIGSLILTFMLFLDLSDQI